MDRFHGVLGIAVILAIAWALSSHKKKIDWQIVLWGLSLQILFGLFVLKTSVGRSLFEGARDVMEGIMTFTGEGAVFIFGNLAKADNDPSVGYILAFRALPVMIVFSALMAMIYHLGIMQLKAMLGGALASFMTACLAGILV